MANILAVDDEKAILNMIESILVKDSHTVTKIDEPDIVNIGLHFFHKDVRLYAASCSEV